MKTYLVIGMGRFGSAVAARLYELGNEVLVVDENEENIQAIASRVTHAVVGDARDEAVLRALGARNFDCAIVAIGGDLAASILVTLALKELGIPAVICKASNETFKRALEKVGADRVVIPEREMAVKLAQSLSSSNVLDFIELSDDFGIAEVVVPDNWADRSIRELNVRAKYGVTILACQQPGEKLQVQPGAEDVIRAGATVTVLGANERIARLQKL
ncbi:MAG: TrkA family potassium uptake protein [Oscillospiraceae bacterium]|nr:TrkA family potassium uptake protein [Oscillospiraceae bacterium]